MRDKPIRILHILYKLDMGGTEKFLMNIFKNINSKEVVFDFLVHGKGAFDSEVQKLGGKIFYLDGYVNQIGIIKYKKILKCFLLTTGQKYQIIHSHVDQTSGLILSVVKRNTNAVCISHSHSVSNYNNFAVKIYKKWLQYQLNQYSDYRLACSKDAGKWLFGKNKFYVIRNGIELEKFYFKKEERVNFRNFLGIDENTFVIGHVGRFESVKNHQFLVTMFAQYYRKDKQSKLLLIGDGSLKEHIKEQIHELGLDHAVIIIDATKEVNKYYNVMDFFVLPSYVEGFGIVAAEAQTNGLPVIVSEGVSREVNITGNVRFLSIEKPEIWVQQIINLKEQTVSKDIKIDKSYHIKSSVNKLLRLYGNIIANLNAK